MFTLFSKKMGSMTLKVLKKGHAERVVFFYPTEEGTYVDDVTVTLFENGIIHLQTEQEVLTTHLQNCEILWRSSTTDEKTPKNLRLLKRFDNSSL